jgi:hypothetical protein
LIPRLFKYCSSRVGMCNIVHHKPMHDRCQSIRADGGSQNRSILAFKAQNPAFVTSFLSNHLLMFRFSGQTIFGPRGVEIPAFVTPYASLCRQRGLAPVAAGILRGVQTL